MVAIQNYKGKDCNVCTQMVRPTINQMLRAIDLDNKMVGLYPVHNRQSAVEKVPKSQQFTTNSGITENASPRNLSRNMREGDRGTLEQDNPEKNTPIGNKTQQFEKNNISIGNNSQQSEIENTSTGNKSQQSVQTDTPHTHTPLLSLISPRRG